MACETARRLVALLRLVQRGSTVSGALTDEALIDSWFGPGAVPLGEFQLKEWPCTYCDDPNDG
ncbi:hypothetical protein PWY87_08425 [Kribbella solani]|uniref:hypothetical protein n=1 Tax=Kribbella solani TaxID=236067 RepID=UPI0029B23F3F|nr:hypothetical protein [Kribbella solani]MDX3001687.1 hypothetical protein [Kribbella solani]